MINYSIIIPHKNIPTLLQRCLDSIPRRTDIQIIVVDDNSDPSIVNFSSFPGMDDPCVEVIFTKESKGAGYARNVGLNKANGIWLIFADADDFFCNGFLNYIDFYVNSNADIIYFDHCSVYSDTLESAPLRMPWVKDYIIQRNISCLRYASHVPWSKMIASSLVKMHSLKFDETKAGNDVMFSAYVGYYSKFVEICSEKIYCVTERRDSLWFGMRLESLRDRLIVSCRYNKFMRKIGKDSEFRIYSFGWVDRFKPFGFKVYVEGLFIYLKNEAIVNILTDLANLLKSKLTRRGDK